MKYIAIFSVSFYEHNGNDVVEKIEYINGYSEGEYSYKAAVDVWTPMDGENRPLYPNVKWIVVEHEE